MVHIRIHIPSVRISFLYEREVVQHNWNVEKFTRMVLFILPVSGCDDVISTWIWAEENSFACGAPNRRNIRVTRHNWHSANVVPFHVDSAIPF